jgi:hypothetical protein
MSEMESRQLMLTLEAAIDRVEIVPRDTTNCEFCSHWTG